MFKKLLVFALTAFALCFTVPVSQAAPAVWVPLPLETQAGYGYTHKLVLDATNCTVLSSNVAGKIFPTFNSSVTTPAGTRLTSAAIKVVTPFAGNGMTAMNAALGNTTAPTVLLPLSAIGTNVAASTWYAATNDIPRIQNSATNLVLTLVPADNAGNALLTNLTAGRLEIYIGLKDLNKL